MINKNKRETGTKYEELAAEYLGERGYRILEKNYRCHGGEIDLIAKDGDYLVFCEVKYRADSASGHPLEAVDRRKQNIISRCARFYLMEHHLEDIAVRFDVVGIYRDDIILIKDAFECA